MKALFVIGPDGFFFEFDTEKDRDQFFEKMPLEKMGFAPVKIGKYDIHFNQPLLRGDWAWRAEFETVAVEHEA